MVISTHPQAKFDPIHPDLDLQTLVQDTPNFEWATHISASEVYALGQQQFEKLVTIHVIHGGKPLVIRDWNDELPKDLFSIQWLEGKYNRKEEAVWDINGMTSISMTMGHYLRSMKQLTDQWTPHNYRDEHRQRLYLKDIDCPLEWQEKLSKVLPRSIFYLNEDIEGGHHGNGYRSLADDGDEMFVDDHPAARAGDLMSSLPPEMRAENLMCYIGHEGTYTPAHREMCASLGQNIMVETSGSENGEKPGSSIWFMTETKDREVVSEYFLSMLGHNVELENHFAQINAWKKAAFPVYIVEQKLGDLILVPPLAPHQVWNRGTRTVKVAWNRTVVETLEMALHEALPKARLVCRDEQYKNKAIIYYTLKKYYLELEYAQTSFGTSQELVRNPVRTAQVADDFNKLLRLFTEILVDEMFGTREKDVEYIPFDSNVTCSYCRANIFNRFLTCKHCVRSLANGDEDTYDVCMECYAMGRSCMCISGLGWCEQWPWEELVTNYDRWRAMVVSNDGFIDTFSSPPPLEVAKLRTGKKPVAQICQEQLCRRPFRDIMDTAVEEVLEPLEPEVDVNGIIKKKAKEKNSKMGDTYRCHVCCHQHQMYRLAFCSTPGCQDAYCYGVLYRGFDMMPQSVMQQAYWKCPRCMNNCNCGTCRRAGTTTPYIPKGTMLGHDTEHIADDRSIESLVNFRLHNLTWLKKCGEKSRSVASKRMQKLRQEADAAKARGDDSHMINGFGNAQNGGQDVLYNSLDSAGTASTVNGHTVDSYRDEASAEPSGDGHTSDDAKASPNIYGASVYRDIEGDGSDPLGLNKELAASIFGRAYYMNDGDAANKILFDPYQEPQPIVGVSDASVLAEPKLLESHAHRPIRESRQEKNLNSKCVGTLDPDSDRPLEKSSLLVVGGNSNIYGNDDDDDDDNDDNDRDDDSRRLPKSNGPRLSILSVKPVPSLVRPGLLPPPTTKFMSMAERMALKGKKFRMGNKSKKQDGNGGQKKKCDIRPTLTVNLPSTVPVPALISEPSSETASIVVRLSSTPNAATKSIPLRPSAHATMTARQFANSKGGEVDKRDDSNGGSLQFRGHHSLRSLGSHGRGQKRVRASVSPSRSPEPATVRQPVYEDDNGSYSSSSTARRSVGGKSTASLDASRDNNEPWSASAHKKAYFARHSGARGRARDFDRSRGRFAGVTRKK